MEISKLYQFLLTNWSNIITFRSRPEYLRHIMVFGSYGRHSKVNILLFADKDLNPFAVVKIPLFQPSQFLENEYNVLSELHKHPQLGTAVPTILYYDYWEGVKILIETAVHGFPVRNMLAEEPEIILSAVTDWLIEFNTSTHQGSLCNEIWYKDRILDPLHSIQSKTKHSRPDLIKKIDRLTEKIQSVNYSSLPLFFAHNDFRTSNLFITSEKQIFTIDWEFSNKEELPLTDLLYFIVHVITDIEQVSYRKAINMLVTQKSSLSNILLKTLNLYCSSLRIDKNRVQDLLLLYGINRVLLSNKTKFSLQSFDGMEWAKDSLDVLCDLVDWSENTNITLTENCKDCTLTASLSNE